MGLKGSLLVCLLFASAFTGCLGGEDAPSIVPAEDSGDSQEAPRGNEPDEEPPEVPRTVWERDYQEGSVTGTELGFGNIIIDGENFHQSFTISEGTLVLYLNLTTGGTELAIGINDPDCDPETATICDAHKTQNGELSLQIEDPLPGGWEVYVGPGEPIVLEEEFHLEITTGILED